MNRFSLTVASVSLLTPSLPAAFEGPYAPDLWTFTTEAGGFIDKHTADTLVLVGGDSGLAGETDVVVTAVASGTLSFDWSFHCPDLTNDWEYAYYLINRVEFRIVASCIGFSGSIETEVQAGDIIGFRLFTADGIFGPGTLTITNFTAPVPAPGAIALLTPLLMAARRRHRREPSETRRPPCTASP